MLQFDARECLYHGQWVDGVGFTVEPETFDGFLEMILAARHYVPGTSEFSVWREAVEDLSEPEMWTEDMVSEIMLAPAGGAS